MASEAVVRFAFGNEEEEEEEEEEEIDWIDSNDNARELDVAGDERERTLRWNEDDGVHRGTKKKRSKKARARDTTRKAVHVVQFLTFYLDAVCQLIYLAQYLAMLTKAMKVRGFLGVGWCQSFSLLICSILLLPVVQLPTFHDSAKFLYFAISLSHFSLASFFFLSSNPEVVIDLINFSLFLASNC